MKRRPVNFKQSKKSFKRQANKTNRKNIPSRHGSPRGGMVL